MRRFVHLPRVLLALGALTLVSGCNYIHFGRIDRSAADAALSAENSDLRVQKKLLQQELDIAHKEGDTLRSALERQPTAASGELVAKLNETSRELASLRADYAQLKEQRDKLEARVAAPGDSTDAKMFASEQIAELKTKLGDSEDKLANTLRLYTQLQEETGRLRTQVDEAHAENATLTKQVAQVTAQSDETRAALTQLNTEFLAEKEARNRAEQDASALRTQLRALTEHGPAAAAPSLTSAREGTAAGASELTVPPTGLAAPVGGGLAVSLSTNPAKVRAAAGAAAADSSPAAAPAASTPPPATPAPAPAPSDSTAATAPATAPAPSATPAPASATRVYVVRPGDTLEDIAEKFYGRRDRWRVLYAANNTQLSGGRPLRPGMQLEIPDEE